MPHIRPKLKQNKLSATWGIMSLNDVKIAGNLINQGFPFSVLANACSFLKRNVKKTLKKLSV